MKARADKPHNRLNLIIGSITIVFLTLFFVALIFSTRKDLLDTRDEYYIISYYSNIGLLQTGAPVKFSGIQIGRVTEIELEDDMRIRVECEFKMTKMIPSDSELAVAATTVSGDTYLSLLLGNAPTAIEHADCPEDAPVLTGLNYIDIRNISSIFSGMTDVTTITANSIVRLFGKDSYTLRQYSQTVSRIPDISKDMKSLIEDKNTLTEKIKDAESEFTRIKNMTECCLDGLLEKYPADQIKSDISKLSSSFHDISETITAVKGNKDIPQIQSNLKAVDKWVSSLTIAKNSILGVLLSKGCGGMTETIKMVGESVKTAQDFSLFKKLGFYIKGKRLLANFEKRTHAEYLPSSVYMYRWSVFSFQRYMHNCNLPCGEKSCPRSLR